MQRTALTAVALIAAAAVVAAPATAKPHKPAKPKAKTFRLAVEGEQLTNWRFTKRQAPSCDWPEYGQGTQYISFRSVTGGAKGAQVRVAAKKGGGVALDFGEEGLSLRADAELERSFDILYSQMTDCPPGQGPFGGDAPPPDEHGTAECTQEGGELEAYFGASIGEVENPSYPTDLPNDPEDGKDRFYFAADPFWTNDEFERSLPAACDRDGMYNADIGITVSQGEWPGGIVPAFEEFSAKKLLKARKPVKIEVGRTVRYPNDRQTWPGPEDTTGKTRVDVTFTFKPVKGGKK